MNAAEYPEPSNALSTAIYQHHLVTQQHTGHCALFLLLFLFLYCILGAALTFDSSPAVIDNVAIYYALAAIPVLVAFSGLFSSILFLFLCRHNLMRINMLAKFTQLPAEQAIFPVNYAPALIFYWLAGFICLTWLVLYNYLTFTTSGVFGSVISLFISTMVYVILDIQLIKQPAVSGPEEQQQETPN